ncbi:hypothetical protein [Streptomyces sp. TP-A0874]|uniref:hypothetical protein n=1 Tax=Streptomyces sp. TP-A0874 TaxID=549819 RepID=UPI000853E446|nr:hypothetical protein [Streptomyces sp. TP-A0874]
MSAMTLALPLAAATAAAMGAAALYTAHGLRRQLTALSSQLTTVREELSSLARKTDHTVSLPAARAERRPVDIHFTDDHLAEIRAAVTDALAEERERDLAEARAFWAAQEARENGEPPGLAGTDWYEDAPLYLPRQADLIGIEPLDDAGGLEPYGAPEEPAESPELAAARRRHPSHPSNQPSPVATAEETLAHLQQLAESRTPLVDVRPGPLGTLDIYVFTDGTTVCVTPGDHGTAEQLARALHEGTAPVLLGGSSVSGAYTLTFDCGRESVYVLADRVVASL